MKWSDYASYLGTRPVFGRKVPMGMRDSEPNSLLSGLLLTGFIFVVLSFGFSYVLAAGMLLGMLFRGDFLHPRWYENVIVIGSGAVPAWLLVKRLVRRISSW